MAREANIPLFLWVATAALVHIMWGETADKVAVVLEEKSTLRSFVAEIREHLRLEDESIEVTLLAEDTSVPSTKAADEGDGLKEDDAPSPPPPEDAVETPVAPPSPTEAPNPAAAKPEPTEPLPPKEDEKKPLVKEEEKVKPLSAEALQALKEPGRIAVRQNVEDKEQADNPNARFLSEHANRVAEETRARITSTDQNEANPTPGASHQGPTDDPGDAIVTDVAQSEARPGDREEAPGEKGVESDGEPAQVAQAAEPQVSGQNAAPGTAADPTAAAAKASVQGREAQEARAEVTSTPERVTVADGAWYLRKPLTGQRAQAHVRERKAQQGRPGEPAGQRVGRLGTLQATPGGLDPNLFSGQALAAVGADQLRRERLADGEQRRSKHRGSFRAQGLERWRSAIENYVAGIQPGNQTALNTARSPFANYIHHIHTRLHPQFAERVLAHLNELPSSHPMNRPDLRTDLEIILNGKDGRILRMGVIRASGVTAFDIEPLEAMSRAAPFGPPPKEIVSPDGNVYLHWGFMRDPNYACSTFAAQPFIRAAETSVAPAPNPPPAAPVETEGARQP